MGEFFDAGEEAHLALLVGAIGAAAGDQRDLAGARADEAADQQAGGAAGRAVVEADIGGALRLREVGDQGQHRHLPGDRGHRLAHQRMFERHEGDAVGALAVMAQRAGERLRVEAFDEVRAAGRIERREGRILGRNVVAEHAQVAVGAARQDEGEPHRRRPQRLVERLARQVLERGRRLDHALRGRGAHPGAAVEHPVHGRGRDPGALGDVPRPRSLFRIRNDFCFVKTHQNSSE
jgi:hypothetical protein